MTETAQRHLTYRLSHVFVRSLASMNLVGWTLDTFSPQYTHAMANGPMSNFFMQWLLISSVALPLYTGLEFLWMRSIKSERRALWIDGILTVAWAVFFWIRILYGFTHRVLF